MRGLLDISLEIVLNHFRNVWAFMYSKTFGGKIIFPKHLRKHNDTESSKIWFLFQLIPPANLTSDWFCWPSWSDWIRSRSSPISLRICLRRLLAAPRADWDSLAENLRLDFHHSHLNVITSFLFISLKCEKRRFVRRCTLQRILE